MYFPLKLKIISFIVLPITLVYLVIGAYLYQTFHKRTADTARANMQLLVDRYANDLAAGLDELSQIARVAASFVEITPDISERQIYALLSAEVSANRNVYGAAVAFDHFMYSDQQRLFAPYVFRAGDQLQRQEIGADAYDYTNGEWDWWNVPKARGTGLWTDPYFDEGLGNVLMSTFSIPFSENGTFRGIVTVDIALTPLRELVLKTLDPRFSAYILSTTGRFVFHPDPALVLKGDIFSEAKRLGIPELEVLGNYIQAGESGDLKIIEQEHVWYYFYAPVEATGWGIAMRVSEDDLFGDINEQLIVVSVLLTVLMVLVVVFVWSVVGRLTHPLSVLDTATRMLAGRQRFHMPSFTGNDEIGRLGRAFSTMAETLLKRERDLSDAKEDVEKRVTARTRELNETNQVLTEEMEYGEQARLKLQSSEQHFRTLVENLPGAVYRCEWHGEWIIQYASNRFERIYGIRTDKLLGQPLSVLREQIYPLDRSHVSHLENTIASDQAQLSLEYRVLNPKAGVLWVRELDSVISDSEGQPRYLDGLLFDITERKRDSAALRLSQERFRRLENGLEQEYFFFSRNPDGSLAHISRSVEKILGYSIEDIGSDFNVIFNEQQALRLIRMRFDRVIRGEQLEPTIVAVRHKDGSARTLEIVSVPVAADNGQIVAVEGIAKDITLAKQTEQELRKARDQAEYANRAKNIFLSNMSHELRTPLNGILGYAQILMRNEELPPAAHEGAGIIRRSGEQLLSLINDILDLSQLESRALDLYPDSVSLPVLIDEVYQICLPSAQAKKLKLEMEQPGTVPEYVYTDGVRLRQVLLHLVDNAIKYTERGFVRLHVKMSGEDRIRFEVEDSGKGIDASEIDNIFSAFHQGEVNQPEGGTGLGLVISKRIVNAMGGEIEVQSRPGAGSVFSFEIGLTRLLEGPRLETEEHWRLIADANDCALVVDDIEINRGILETALAGMGYRVVSAENGEQALRVMHDHRVDLVFTDIRMPEMDGIALAHRIRSEDALKHIPLIAVTASVAQDFEDGYRAHGFDACIRKPLFISELIDTLKVYGRIEAGGTSCGPNDDPDVVTAVADNSAPEISRALLQRILDAARLGDLTALDACHGELVEMPQAAARLAAMIAAFDFDGIVEWVDNQLPGAC